MDTFFGFYISLTQGNHDFTFNKENAIALKLS